MPKILKLLPKDIKTYDCKCCGTPINAIRLTSQPNTKRGYYFVFDKRKKFCSRVCKDFHQIKDDVNHLL